MPTLPKLLNLFFLLSASIFVVGCAADFSLSDPKTWRAETRQDRYIKAKRAYLKEACGFEANATENQRVVVLEGVDEPYYHTECVPHTQNPPQHINRLEGR